MSNTEEKAPETIETNGNLNKDGERKNWVKFDDESPQESDLNAKSKVSDESVQSVTKSGASTSEIPAVLKTETVHINLDRSENNIEPLTQSAIMRNVEYINARHGFCKFYLIYVKFSGHLIIKLLLYKV